MADDFRGGDKSSEYNEAFLKMRRLGELQEQANIAQVRGNEKQWFHIISALCKEIYSKLTDKEKKEIFGLISKIGARLKSSTNISNAEHSTLPIVGKIPAPASGLLYEFDCRVRELMDIHRFTSPAQ